MLRCIFALCIACFFLWTPTLYKRTSHAFRPAKCALEWPAIPAWETPAPTPEITAILQQPFSYLGKGKQAYVFQSQDQKYVLKLFRYDLCAAPWGQKVVRIARKFLGLHERHELPAFHKIMKNFTSCKLAYSLAPEQTGVVFVHLNPKKGLPLIQLQDRRGVTHIIDPAKTRFVLQKKGQPLLHALRNEENDRDAIVQGFRQLLHELKMLGIANLDPTMGRNFGYLDGRVIVLDIGNFIYDPAASQVSHFENRLDQWVEKNLHRKGSQ